MRTSPPATVLETGWKSDSNDVTMLLLSSLLFSGGRTWVSSYAARPEAGQGRALRTDTRTHGFAPDVACESVRTTQDQRTMRRRVSAPKPAKPVAPKVNSKEIEKLFKTYAGAQPEWFHGLSSRCT